MEGHFLKPLEQLLTAVEPEEIRRTYFALPSDWARIAGSTAPALRAFDVTTRSGLVIPSADALPSPIDYAGSYVTLRDYLGPADDRVSVDGVLHEIIARFKGSTLLPLSLPFSITSRTTSN